jgi:hypothetical protein
MRLRGAVSPLLFAALAALPANGSAGRSAAQTQTFSLHSLEGLKLNKLRAEAVTYNGRQAIRVTEDPEIEELGEDRLVIVTGITLQDGVIEIDLAGNPGAGAFAGARGFIGIAFRVASDLSHYECFYLRPTNGRAEDQLRRNHSTQYISFPDYPWHRLRRESPGVYESYVDLVPGEWTKVKIEVSGLNARLYVHGAEQPTLLVKDLKLGEISGAIALWVGPGTEAYFTNLRVSQ